MDRGSLPALYRDHVARLEREVGAAAEEHGFDALLIHAGAPATKSGFDDQDWPMRPTPAFAHFIDLPEPDDLLVVRPGAKPRLIRVVTDDFWEGAPDLDLDHAWDCFEVTAVDDPAKVGAELPGGRRAFIGDLTDRAAAWEIPAEATNPTEIVRALDRIRRVKSDYEAACVAEANRRGAAGHQAIARAFAAGDRSELELHLEYLRATAQDDSETPYKNIVAIDRHAAVLHHVHYGREAPGAGPHALLVDAGATCFGYASDITRTTPKDAPDFAALVDRIEAMQRELCRALVAGVEYQTLHDRAHRMLARILREVGLATGGDDELVEAGITRAFFPHGLGHSIGVQVHDVGCRPTEPRPENAFLRTTVTAEPGMIFTVEPGCYFIEGLLGPVREGPHAALVDWDEVHALAPFGGVRIEDNVLVTAGGNRNLTRDNWPEPA